MATVTLSTVWLNDATDLTDSQSFPFMSKLTVTPTSAGQVRRYSGGRFRAITQAGVQRQAQLTLPACDLGQVYWINDHAARLLLVRDDRGRKFWGIYYAPQADEHPYDANADVTLTITEVSHSEAV